MGVIFLDRIYRMNRMFLFALRTLLILNVLIGEQLSGVRRVIAALDTKLRWFGDLVHHTHPNPPSPIL